MSGDVSATAAARFDRVISVHGAALRRLAATYTRTATDRDDLFQEIALALWKALPRFRGECSERTFVFRVAHNRGIAHVTRSRNPGADPDEVAALVDQSPNPETALVRGQQGERLLAAIQQLPLGQRQVVALILEELSYAEIADVLGISEANVGTRLTRARQALKVLLEGER
jgi:RNA polymerase sigma factor (sigma-70 family)